METIIIIDTLLVLILMLSAAIASHRFQMGIIKGKWFEMMFGLIYMTFSIWGIIILTMKITNLQNTSIMNTIILTVFCLIVILTLVGITLIKNNSCPTCVGENNDEGITILRVINVLAILGGVLTVIQIIIQSIPK